MDLRVDLGPVRVYLWSGSWSWVQRLPCAQCWNLYLGPFGVEVARPQEQHE